MTRRPEYQPEPVPASPVAVELPPDWGQKTSRAPFVHTAAIAGCTEVPPQLGFLGWAARGRWPVSLTLNTCLALAFFGSNESGKSYGMGVVLEMLVQLLGSINNLVVPWAGLVLHYHGRSAYPPEQLQSVLPNQEPSEVERLVHWVRALPRGLADVLVLTLREQVALVRAENPHAQVHPLRFALRELGLEGLRRLLGLADTSPLYARQVERILRELLRAGKALTWRRLLRAIARGRFPRAVRQRLLERLALVRPWVDDRGCLRDYLRPGRMIIIDIRDEWLSKDLAMDLFGMAVGVLAMHPAQRDPGACPVVVAYDEVHN